MLPIATDLNLALEKMILGNLVAMGNRDSGPHAYGN